MIWQQTVPTVRDTLAGFVLAALFGVGLASLLRFRRLLRDAIYPLIVVIQLVPRSPGRRCSSCGSASAGSRGSPSPPSSGFSHLHRHDGRCLESTDRSLVRVVPRPDGNAVADLLAGPPAGLYALSLRWPQDRHYTGRDRRHRRRIHLLFRGIGLPDPEKRRAAAHRYHLWPPSRFSASSASPATAQSMRANSPSANGRANGPTSACRSPAFPATTSPLSAATAARLIAPPAVLALLLFGGWEAAEPQWRAERASPAGAKQGVRHARALAGRPGWNRRSPPSGAPVAGIMLAAALGIALGGAVSYSRTLMQGGLSHHRLLPAHPQGGAGAGVPAVVRHRF